MSEDDLDKYSFTPKLVGPEIIPLLTLTALGDLGDIALPCNARTVNNARFTCVDEANNLLQAVINERPAAQGLSVINGCSFSGTFTSFTIIHTNAPPSDEEEYEFYSSITDGSISNRYAAIPLTTDIMKEAISFVSPDNPILDGIEGQPLTMYMSIFLGQMGEINQNNKEELQSFIRNRNWGTGYAHGRAQNMLKEGVSIGDLRRFLYENVPMITRVIYSSIDGLHRATALKYVLTGTVPKMEPPDVSLETSVKEYSETPTCIQTSNIVTMNFLVPESKIDKKFLSDMRMLSTQTQGNVGMAVGHGRFELLKFLLEHLHQHIPDNMLLFADGSTFMTLLNKKRLSLKLKETSSVQFMLDTFSLGRDENVTNDWLVHTLYPEITQIYENNSKMDEKKKPEENEVFIWDLVEPFLHLWKETIVSKYIRDAFVSVQKESKSPNLFRDLALHEAQEHPTSEFKFEEVPPDDWLKMVKRGGAQGTSEKEAFFCEFKQRLVTSWATTNPGKDSIDRDNRYSCPPWRGCAFELTQLLLMSLISPQTKRAIFSIPNAKNSTKRQVTTAKPDDEKRFMTCLVQVIGCVCHFGQYVWSPFFSGTGVTRRSKNFRVKNLPKIAQYMCLLHHSVVEVVDYFIPQGFLPEVPSWCKDLEFKQDSVVDDDSMKACMKNIQELLQLDKTMHPTNFIIFFTIAFCHFLSRCPTKNVKEEYEHLQLFAFLKAVIPPQNKVLHTKTQLKALQDDKSLIFFRNGKVMAPSPDIEYINRTITSKKPGPPRQSCTIGKDEPLIFTPAQGQECINTTLNSAVTNDADEEACLNGKQWTASIIEYDQLVAHVFSVPRLLHFLQLSTTRQIKEKRRRKDAHSGLKKVRNRLLVSLSIIQM